MKIVFGLGNPGTEYTNTRHNIGFTVLEKLKDDLNFDDFQEDSTFKGEIASGTYKGEKVILVKPLTYMNRSGECVQAVIRYYKVDISDVYIVFDDIDLPLGSFRIRSKGSAGTHNGVKSIMENLKNENFGRFRIGIESRGEETAKQQTTESFVLDRFKKNEITKLNKVLDKIIEAIKFCLIDGVGEAMNKFNKKTLDF